MTKKELPKEKKLPKLTVVNGWERKNFIIKTDDGIEIEFCVKYKKSNHLKYVIDDFEIFEIIDDEENIIKFSDSIEYCELKMVALKSCLTFLKTGALVLENINE